MGWLGLGGGLPLRAANRKTQAAYASGLQREWTYDAADQVVSIVDQNGVGATLARLTFAVDEIHGVVFLCTGSQVVA